MRSPAGDLNRGHGDVLLGVNDIHEDDYPGKVFEECVIPQASGMQETARDYHHGKQNTSHIIYYICR